VHAPPSRAHLSVRHAPGGSGTRAWKARATIPITAHRPSSCVKLLTLPRARKRTTDDDALLIAGADGPFLPHVKLIRLQSGPLACVYQDEDAAPPTEREGSGVYRAFSGSIEAAGASESEALDTLDRTLQRLSSLPGNPGKEEVDPEQAASSSSNDTDHCPPRFHSILPPASSDAPDTVRAPCASSLPAVAFAAAR